MATAVSAAFSENQELLGGASPNSSWNRGVAGGVVGGVAGGVAGGVVGRAHEAGVVKGTTRISPDQQNSNWTAAEAASDDLLIPPIYNELQVS